MLYLFDKHENLLGFITENQIKSIYQAENLSAPYILTAQLPHGVDIENALYAGHKDVLNPETLHLYRIVGRQADDRGHLLDGVLSAYDDLLADGFIKDQRPTDKPVSEVLGNILTGSRWQVGTVNTTRTVTTNFYYVSRLAALQEMCKAADCEIKPRIIFDGHKITGRYIDVADRLGEDRGKRFAHGSNLLQVIKTDDSSAIFTALIGRGKGLPAINEDGEATGGYGRKIGFGDVVWSTANGDPVDKQLGQEWVEVPSLTAVFGYPDGNPRIGFVDFPQEEDEEELLRKTYERVLETGRPKVSYRTAVRDMGDTGIGDTVTVIRDDLGIRYKTRIYKRTINLLNPADIVIEIGDNIQNYTTQKLGKIDDQIRSGEVNTRSSALALVDFIKSQMGNVYWGEDGWNYDLELGNPYDMPAGFYSFDKPIDQDPTKFVYVGAGKIVIANEKDVQNNWVLKTLIDGDGLGTGVVGADQVIAGSITADLIRLQGGDDVATVITDILAGKITLTSQTIITEDALDALKGEDAVQWTIGEDGFWYADGVKTNKRAIGIDGTDGEGTDLWTIGANGNWYKNGVDTGLPSQGADGNGIKSTQTHYAVSASGSSPPVSGWQTNVPAPDPGKYLWTRIVLTLDNNSTQTSYSVSRYGADGSPGAPGAAGRGIDTIVREYYIHTTATAPAQNATGWTATRPVFNSTTHADKILWTRLKITYVNPASTEYKDVAIDETWGVIDRITHIEQGYLGVELLVNEHQTKITDIYPGYISITSVVDGETLIDGGKITTQSITSDKFYGDMIESFEGDTWIKLSDPSEIVQMGTVGGQTVKVTMSPTKPFQVDIDGEKMVYISPNTGKLVTDGKYDIDENGVVDARELDLIIRHMYEGATYPQWMMNRLDINGDGKINSIDLSRIVDYIHRGGQSAIPGVLYASNSQSVYVKVTSNDVEITNNQGTVYGSDLIKLAGAPTSFASSLSTAAGVTQLSALSYGAVHSLQFQYQPTTTGYLQNIITGIPSAKRPVQMLAGTVAAPLNRNDMEKGISTYMGTGGSVAITCVSVPNDALRFSFTWIA